MAQGTKLVDAALRVPCTEETFVRRWFEILKPIHKLTAKEMDVAIEFVKTYKVLKERIPDERKLNKVLFSKETKDEICERLGMKPPHLRTVMQQLRRREIILEGNELNHRYVPDYVPGSVFRLMFLFTDATTVRKDTESNSGGTEHSVQ